MEIPIINEINLRENPTSNKFIQLEVFGKPYFRFIRPNDTGYHCDIFGNTLINEFKIIPEFDEIPLAKGKDYKLVGAGLFRKDKEKIILYGRSADYQIKPNKEHAEEISKLTGLEFIIEG